MKELIEYFQRDAEIAIKKYEDLFEDHHDISRRRSTDLMNLREYIGDHCETLDECMASTRKALRQIETGWWKIKTGRSRLKKFINEVIESYQDRFAPILVQRICDLEGQLNEIEDRRRSIPMADEQFLMAVKYRDENAQLLSNALKTIKKENEDLRRENKQLRNEIEMQKISNKNPTMLSTRHRFKIF